MDIDHSHIQSRQETFQLISPLHLQRPYSLPVSTTAVQGETPPFRNAKVVSHLPITPENEVRSVTDLVRRAAKFFGNKPAVGFRTEIRTHLKESSDKKQLIISELSSYKFLSYIEYEQLVTNIGSGLVKAGLLSSHDKICMWGQTSMHWLAVFHGAASQSIAIVTAYSNLGLSGLQHALDSTDAVAIFVDSSSISRLAVTLEAVPSLRLVIYKNDSRISDSTISKLGDDFSHVNFIEFDELCAMGKSNPAASHSPDSEKIAAIMYTSGSTGNPKGVPIKHKNIIAAIAGWDTVLGRHFDHNDVYLAYLPLAHIMEFISEHVLLFWGVCIGYGSPRTLFATYVENCKGDLCELRPTYMCGVPAIMEAMRKSIIATITATSPEQQTAFWDALGDKKRAFSEGTEFPNERDTTTFSAIRGIFGGRLRYMMTGGSGIAKNTQEFLSFVVAPVTGGYGMTETTGTGAMMDPSQWQTGSLGGIHGCVEVKLIDYEEAGYFASSSPPEGEICIRGGSVVDGYWKDEVETRNAFTNDGWLKTGDIGKMDEHGSLWIIDRKKNLVKNLNGQYIALEKLESIYRSCSVVANVCIYADSARVKPIAIILPIEGIVNTLLQSSTDREPGSSDAIEAQRVLLDQLEQKARLKEVQRIVLDQLQQKAREYDFPGLEVVEGVVLSPLKEWDVTNGMTTAVGKLNRKAIVNHHHQDIKELRIGLEK